jgi:hypothetical protein
MNNVSEIWEMDYYVEFSTIKLFLIFPNSDKKHLIHIGYCNAAPKNIENKKNNAISGCKIIGTHLNPNFAQMLSSEIKFCGGHFGSVKNIFLKLSVLCKIKHIAEALFSVVR